MCLDSDGNYTPPPSAEESNLKQLQYNIAQQEAALNTKLAPMLMNIMGYRLNPDTGVLEQKRAFEPSTGPALEKNLAAQEAQAREALSRRLGPGYETSTPGIQSLTKLRESQELQREEARRASLSLASDIQNRQFGQALQLTTPGSQLLGSLSGVIQPYQAERAALAQQNLYNQQQQNNALSSIAQLGYGIVKDIWG